MQERKAIISGFLPNIDWWSAGKLAYQNTDKGRKKIMVTPHKDNMPINQQTNMLKAQLADKYLVIDSDSADLDKLAELYPSILNTFATRTTGSYKRHFYFQPIKGVTGVRKTGLEAEGEYDILTTGIIFEGHNIPTQEEEWTVINDNEVGTLTEGETDLIMHLCRNSIATGNSGTENKYFNDSTTASIVAECVENERLPKDDKTWKQLWFGLSNQDYRDLYKGKRKRIPIPNFDHATFNTIAYKLSYNMSLDHETRDKFLTLLLQEGYDIDVNSPQTYNHLHKSILATLPRHDRLSDVLKSESFKDSLAFTISEGKAVVKFINERGVLAYMFLDEHSLKPVPMAKFDGVVTDAATLIHMRQYSKDDLQAIPLVKVIVNPFEPYISFDDRSALSTVNLSEQTEYYDKATPVPTKPDNVLTRLITSYFGAEYQEFYYHWLAHLMYNSRPPQTMPMLVSTRNDMAATGKSTLAQSIPARLVAASATADINSTEAGWGDLTMGRKLISFNDMKQMSKNKWEPVYAFAKDHSTSGARRLENMKFGGFTLSTSSNAFSFSANWIPPMDEHDRRLWVVFPQMIYGSSKLLEHDDIERLNYVIEASDMTVYHEEFQELANYLKYLFENFKNKFNTELYITAPITPYRAEALKSQRNYSETLLHAITNSPEALENIIGSDIMVFVSKFLILQYDGSSTYLPTQFLAKLLNELHKDGQKKYTNKRLEDSLGLDPNSFKNRGPTHIKYKDEANLGMFDESEQFEIESYVHTQIKLPIGAETIHKYENYILEHNDA